MFDFINSIEISKELKIKQIYELFKTESLELNNKFLSELEKYSNSKDYIEHYINIDTNKIINVLKNLLLASFKIMDEDNINKSEFELYLSGSSKIISLLCFIQRINQLQNEIIKNTKNYIKNLYKKNKKESIIKEKIDSIINDIIFFSQLKSKNISRRSTEDITNTSFSFNFDNKTSMKENESVEIKKDSNSNINKLDFFAFRTLTPKFVECETEEKNNINNNNNNCNLKESIDLTQEKPKRDSFKIDSSLTLQKMKFEETEEKNEKLKQPLKKFRSDNIKHRSSSSSKKNKRKKNKCFSSIPKSCFFKDNKCSFNNHDNDNRKILSELLDSINSLYKEGKISSEQKLTMKQIIIANPTIIIDKYYNSQKKLNNNNIQKFLMDELKDL